MENTASQTATLTKTLPDSLARKVLLQVLTELPHGCLTLVEGDIHHRFGEPNTDLHATMVVKHASFYRQILLNGSIGAGESYIQGYWSSPDLTKVIQIFARNLTLLDKIEAKFSWLTGTINRIKHFFNRNSKAGAKRNILAHYDLGNDMYAQFLDKEMLYSSAIYPNNDTELDAAQQYKLHTICERLQLKHGDTLLEIGTGWGALAIYAAKYYGVTVTTTTISDAQYAYAKARVEAEGLSDQVTLLTEDYRNLSGRFDRIVSIEMIEAVGHEYLPGFFKKLSSLLKPDGLMLLQAITIADQRYDMYRNNVDFIQRYIFPGGCLPSVSQMATHLAKQTDMIMWSLNDIGHDYAKTLQHWHTRFDQASVKIHSLGYGDDFIRMWKFYLSYCEGGFLERTTSAVHLVAAGPGYRLPMPPLEC